MKKLSITKEAFEKSKYFTRKYGKLEYVSESGKLFKTGKGKILMFKESIKDIAPGIQDWGSTIYVEPLEVEMSWDDVYYIVKKDCRQYPLLEEELGLEPYEEPSDEQIREWIETNPKSFMDYLEEFGSYNATDFSGDDEYDESTKKFGKKFKESNSVGEKWAVFVDDGIDEIFDSRDEAKSYASSIRDDSDSYNRRTRAYVKKLSRSEIEDMFGESVGDASTDPAYECPYCGGRNCEYVNADEYPDEGYFDGTTLLAEFLCHDCEKSYAVTFKLNVDDVIPAPPHRRLNIPR